MSYMNYPILKVLIPYILGILFVYFIQNISYNILIISILIIIFLIIYWVICIYFHTIFSSFVFVPLAVIFFLIGILLTQKKLINNSSSIIQKNTVFSGYHTAIIVEPPQEKKKSIKIIADTYNQTLRSPMGKVIYYFQKDQRSMSLHYGDVLYLHTDLSPIAPPKNPEAFNYQKYMLRKGIVYSGFVSAGCWMQLSHTKTNFIYELSHRSQQYFSSLFSQNGLNGPEYAIITAILLGNDDSMEDELRYSYTAAGVSHILCVSGMHVGIIYMIINFLLYPLNYSNKMRWIKSLILLFAIWFYASLTGFSPSVQRAATMFSFITFGDILRRNVNIFHSLFTSLFFLLLYNPLLIVEIGFQMSYLAVFGIVLFQPLFKSLLSPNSKIINYFWELICVSCAAQLTTFPLSVYYFGQFPNYFILSNISVMSLSFAVVVSGVVVLALSWWQWLAQGCAWLLTHEIKCMNWIIQTIASLPGSTINQISIDIPHVMLIYVTIIILFVYIKKRNKYLKYSFLISIIIILISFIYAKIKCSYKDEMIIFSVDNMSIIEFVSHGHGVLFVDSNAYQSHQWYDYAVKNYERKYHIESQRICFDTNEWIGDNFIKKDHFFLYHHHLFFIISGRQWIPSLSSPLNVSWLYMRNSPSVSPEKLQQTFDFQGIIIDESCTIYNEQKWLAWCKKNGKKCYSLRQEGYFLCH